MSLERLEEHRRLWEAKPDLQAVYGVWFEVLLDGIPQEARVLEVGSGPGFLADAARRRRPDLRWISSDLLVTPWNDLAADAGRLPLVTGSVDVVVGIDVLHHLPRPAEFFREAARVLGGVGEVRLVEPWITPLGFIVYRFFHQEDCHLGVDPWEPFPGPEKDAFDGDAAVPWRLVRDPPPWEWRYLGFEPPRRRRLNTFAYLLSLGFREKSLLGPGLLRPLLALDRWTELLSPLLGLRAFLVWPSAAPAAARGTAGSAGDAGQTRKRRPTGRRPAALLALLALAALTAILTLPRWGPASERWRIVRLLPPPEEDLDQSELYHDAELARVSFSSRSEGAGWTSMDGSPLEISGGALRLTGDQAVGRIVGPLGRDADAVQVIEVEVEQSSPSPVALFWPRSDGRFVSDRAIARVPDADGVARFAVATHPRWRGRIPRIAVQPSFSPQAAGVLGVRVLGWRLSPERVREVPAGVRAVELGGDRRPAVAVVDGRPATRSVAVPPRARLCFALGLPDHGDASARLTLSLTPPDGSEETLLEVRARPGGGAPGWTEHEVDLTPWGGQTVELSMRLVDADGPSAAPIGFWANPRFRLPDTGPRRPSVLLISADTLRADHLPFYGYHRPTAPHLGRWAEERGVVFRETVAPSPWTLPSHVSLLSGVDAHRHGVSRQGPIPREIPVLAERFRDAGYLTLGTTGGGLVAHRFGFGRGFDVYRNREKTARSEPGGELAKGLEETLEWLSEHADEPFFLFLHTYETHTPLEPREPFFTRLRGHDGPLPDRPLNAEPLPARASDGFRQLYRFAWTLPLPDGADPPPPPPGLDLDDPQLALDLYDSTIANLDAALGQVLARLEELGLADETVVAFTSDHGESFGENGLYAHAHLQDSNLMVPLVMSPRPPAGPLAVDAQVRVVDVAPTLLEMAGLPPLPAAQGRSLVPLIDGTTRTHPELAWSYAARTNRGLGLRVANRLKLIVPNTVWAGARGKDELFDLLADPAESRNVAESDDAYAALRELAGRELAVISQGVVIVASCERAPCFEAVLTGLGRQRFGVTSPDLACDCVTPEASGTRVSPGPGDRFTIVYEDIVDGDLGIALDSTGPGTLEREIRRRVGPGEPPFALRRAGSGWEVEEDAEGPPGVGLHVSYRGTSTEALPEVAQEMEERLRALGYVK